ILNNYGIIKEWRKKMSLLPSINSSQKTITETTNLHEVEAASTLVMRPPQESLHELMERALTLKEGPALELKSRDVVPKTAEDLFQTNALLIRGMSDEEVFDDFPDTGRPKLGAFRSEMEYMKNDGLVNTSSTLGVPGKGVGMYKPLAFLFNGESSELQHIYGIDSNSCTSSDGKLLVGKNSELTFATLEDLAIAIKTTNLLTKTTINEVNGKFTTKDLVGLAARSLKSNPQGDAALNLKFAAFKSSSIKNISLIFQFINTTKQLVL
ncbi:MAG: hypothetical protein KDK59_03085, partial [Simkania sp.]|nr:hypothetical protein [Simkania sp.]